MAHVPVVLRQKFTCKRIISAQRSGFAAVTVWIHSTCSNLVSREQQTHFPTLSRTAKKQPRHDLVRAQINIVPDDYTDVSPFEYLNIMAYRDRLHECLDIYSVQ
jgi:hypothetical protein